MRQARSSLNLQKDKEDLMLWTVAVILFVLWALGLFAFHVGGGLIHLLIVAAVIVLLYQLITGRRTIA
jgi:hypothetical protein